MENRIYDYWAATLQDGYIGNLVEIVNRAGGARSLYEMSEKQLRLLPDITDKLADYIIERRIDPGLIERNYMKMSMNGICYVNHDDDDFPRKLLSIPSTPYGLFVKGSLPDPGRRTVAIVGARECSEYGRLMAEYLGSRLAKEGIDIISGMAWGIDGIAQSAAIEAGGRSYAVLGCGADIPYPAKNRSLYNSLCIPDNGIISEYAPGTKAIARLFPPRNRIISGLCDVLIVVEARKRSGTLITADLAVDQGKCIMIVPGRLTDNLSTGCLNLLSQGAIPVTGIESVLEQLAVNEQLALPVAMPNKKRVRTGPVRSISLVTNEIPGELQRIASVLTLEPQSVEAIAGNAGVEVDAAMIMLTKLELEGSAREIWPGYFVENASVS